MDAGAMRGACSWGFAVARRLTGAPAEAGAPLRGSVPAATRAYWSRAARLAAARIWPFLAFVLLYQVFNVVRLGTVVGYGSVGSAAVASMAVNNVLTFLSMFATIVLTEALALRRWSHLFASFAALLLGQLVVTGVMQLLYGGTNMPLFEARIIVYQTGMRDLWMHMGIGMLLVVYFAFREHELAAAKAAQDANTQRATVERATVAARLKVMQARVEPELLFGALSDVRELYLRDRHAAEALLDDLIAYLRAALPQMRSDSSSLGREATLAVAYARVLPAARRGDLAASSDIPDDTKDLPFPPMVLLPLVRAAAQSPVSRISIESGGTPVSGATVRVEPAQHPAGWDDAGLEGVRAALAHAFGAEARLDVQGDRVVVRWPANARE
jgi:hypothetical protein